MMRRLWQWPLIRAGLGAACVGAAVLAGAVRQALYVDDVPADGTSSPLRGVPGARARVSGYALDRVLSAVAKDPFHPERRRPGARFRLPARTVAVSARRQGPPAMEGTLRLVGTAVGADGGGFAMCAWQGATPRIVRVGEQIGEWTLQRVSPGAAEFATPGGATITVRVPKAGA
jgi:hypothetical protein